MSMSRRSARVASERSAMKSAVLATGEMPRKKQRREASVASHAFFGSMTS